MDPEQPQLPGEVHTDKSLGVGERRAALPDIVQTPEDVRKALEIIRDPDDDPNLRAAVLARMATEIGHSQVQMDMALDVLKDRVQPTPLRISALRAIQQTGFHSRLFAPNLPEFMAALRETVTDPEPELRQRVLEVLAQRKDEFAQRILLEGLRDPAAALLPPENAIQLLAYDIHAEHFPLLREIVRNPPNAAAKLQAIRSLAADPGAKPLLTALLRDASEVSEVRNLAAMTLRALDPAAFETEAKVIIPNDAEPEDLRVTCLTALTLYGDRTALRADTALTAQAERIKIEFAAAPVARAAAKFLDELRKP